MEKLKEAFEERIGRQDHESFIKVVLAFLDEVRENALITVPVRIAGDQGYQPLTVPLEEDSYAVVIVSDPEYMNYFNDKSHMMLGARTIISLMEENEKIGGILINPFSDSHCFLPRKDTLTVIKENKIIED